MLFYQRDDAVVSVCALADHGRKKSTRIALAILMASVAFSLSACGGGGGSAVTASVGSITIANTSVVEGNGVVNSGGGTLWHGNSNGGLAGVFAANNLGATDTTENATFDVNRRTWLLTNGVMANDSAVPATYCKATNADASLESVNAATEAVCTVWDVAGNVWQLTRGLIAANAATSSTGLRAGGDRFIDGASGIQQYSNVTLQANAPAWWIPKLAGGTVLTATQNIGLYYDGKTQTGAWDTINLGYGTGFVSGFAAVNRGGSWYDASGAALAAPNNARNKAQLKQHVRSIPMNRHRM